MNPRMSPSASRRACRGHVSGRANLKSGPARSRISRSSSGFLLARSSNERSCSVGRPRRSPVRCPRPPRVGRPRVLVGTYVCRRPSRMGTGPGLAADLAHPSQGRTCTRRRRLLLRASNLSGRARRNEEARTGACPRTGRRRPTARNTRMKASCGDLKRATCPPHSRSTEDDARSNTRANSRRVARRHDVGRRPTRDRCPRQWSSRSTFVDGAGHASPRLARPSIGTSRAPHHGSVAHGVSRRGNLRRSTNRCSSDERSSQCGLGVRPGALAGGSWGVVVGAARRRVGWSLSDDGPHYPQIERSRSAVAAIVRGSRSLLASSFSVGAGHADGQCAGPPAEAGDEDALPRAHHRAPRHPDAR
jgi:hypothetical protein